MLLPVARTRATAIDSLWVIVTEGTNMAAALSPDKSQIAIDLQGTIWVLLATGVAVRPSTDALGDYRQPSWSPDGKRILFASDRGINYDLWQLTLTDGKLTQLTNDSGNDFNPAYSPDGTRIAFISDRTDALLTKP